MAVPIVNLADLEPAPRAAGFAPTGPAAERFDARMAPIGRRIGARQLGYNLTVVPPGKRAFPFHNHQVNEEMFFVIAGAGEVRIGAQVHPIRAGDVIACLAGGPETAHQIVNTGAVELRYLAISTTMLPDIAEYPDSGKFGFLGAPCTGPDGQPKSLRFVGRVEDGRNYWEGE